MSAARLVPIAAALLLAACATPRSEEQVRALVAQALGASRAHFEAGEPGAAAVLWRAAARVAPGDPGVRALREELGPQTVALVEPGGLGVNRRPRPPEQRSVLARIGWYPLDRFADLTDVLSFDVGIALGGAIRVHVTRAVQAGFGMGWQYGVGLLQPRIVGAQQELEIGVTALNYAQFQMSGRRSGVSGPVVTGAADLTGASTPGLALYQDYRDYWSVGVGVRIGVVGANAAVHPVQLIDWLLGFALIDIAHDDHATTRALALRDADRRMLTGLSEVEEARLYAR